MRTNKLNTYVKNNQHRGIRMKIWLLKYLTLLLSINYSRRTHNYHRNLNKALANSPFIRATYDIRMIMRHL